MHSEIVYLMRDSKDDEQIFFIDLTGGCQTGGQSIEKPKANFEYSRKTRLNETKLKRRMPSECLPARKKQKKRKRQAKKSNKLENSKKSKRKVSETKNNETKNKKADKNVDKEADKEADKAKKQEKKRQEREAAALGDVNLDKCYEDSDRFVTSLDNLKKTLNDYGVAIVAGILDEKDCEHMTSGMWDYLEKVSENFPVKISRDKPDTWKEMSRLSPLHSMLLKHYGIGQCQMMWDLRQNPRVIEPFCKIWDTDVENLLCSFDGASFGMPPEVTKKGWSRKNYPFWWHTDQNFLNDKRRCFQSWVTSQVVEKGDATLAVLVGSHKHHEQFGKDHKLQHKADWYKLGSKEEVDWYKKRGCYPALIRCPAGAMVFWDSRTIHCGFQALQGRLNEHLRCIGYICMTPKTRCSRAVLKKRVRALTDLRTTSHWPESSKYNGINPRIYSPEQKAVIKSVTPLPLPRLAKVGLQLVGYTTAQFKKYECFEE